MRMMGMVVYLYAAAVSILEHDFSGESDTQTEMLAFGL